MLHVNPHTMETKGAKSVLSAPCAGFSGARRAEWLGSQTSRRYRSQLSILVDPINPPTV